jgi:molybdopterin-guanine dinucleotide biosynthesis protein
MSDQKSELSSPMRVTIKFEGEQATGKTLLSKHIEALLEAEGFKVLRGSAGKLRRNSKITRDQTNDTLFVEEPAAQLMATGEAATAMCLTRDEIDTIAAVRAGTATVVSKTNSPVAINLRADADLEAIKAAVRYPSPGIITALRVGEGGEGYPTFGVGNSVQRTRSQIPLKG